MKIEVLVTVTEWDGVERKTRRVGMAFRDSDVGEAMARLRLGVHGLVDEARTIREDVTESGRVASARRGDPQPVRLIADSCLAKVQPGEPIFVLRAQDTTAPDFVEGWATDVDERARLESGQQAADALRAKARGARAVAKAMREWPTRKLPD